MDKTVTTLREELIENLKFLESKMKQTAALLLEYGEHLHAGEMHGAAEMCAEWAGEIKNER